MIRSAHRQRRRMACRTGAHAMQREANERILTRAIACALPMHGIDNQATRFK
jgi:hypothetical protein